MLAKASDVSKRHWIVPHDAHKREAWLGAVFCYLTVWACRVMPHVAHGNQI